MNEGKSVCPSCGCQLEFNDARFCTACGSSIVTEGAACDSGRGGDEAEAGGLAATSRGAELETLVLGPLDSLPKNGSRARAETGILDDWETAASPPGPSGESVSDAIDIDSWTPPAEKNGLTAKGALAPEVEIEEPKPPELKNPELNTPELKVEATPEQNAKPTRKRTAEPPPEQKAAAATKRKATAALKQKAAAATQPDQKLGKAPGRPDQTSEPIRVEKRLAVEDEATPRASGSQAHERIHGKDQQMTKPNPADREKRTIVEEGTRIRGDLESVCPVVVNGRVEGDVKAPSLTVSASGVVDGTARVGTIRCEGELAGDFDAEHIELSGTVKDSTVIRASTIEMKIATEGGKMQLLFGEVQDTAQIAVAPDATASAGADQSAAEGSSSEPSPAPDSAPPSKQRPSVAPVSGRPSQVPPPAE